MPIPTEPIGSIPRPAELLAAMTSHAAGRISDDQLHAAEEIALRDWARRLLLGPNPNFRTNNANPEWET